MHRVIDIVLSISILVMLVVMGMVFVALLAIGSIIITMDRCIRAAIARVRTRQFS